uniref:CSON004996 protein n=1 Tax=Culicoides sonorensis TaxID=179676 RepID=A0A336LG59_CULSO
MDAIKKNSMERKVLVELNRSDMYTTGSTNSDQKTPSKSQIQTPPVNQQFLEPVFAQNQSTPAAPAIKVTEPTPNKQEDNLQFNSTQEIEPVKDVNHQNTSQSTLEDNQLEREGNLLAEESYITPASGLSFLTEQLGNCGIKDALSSDDEAFQECQSFTSSKGINSNPDSRALTPVNIEVAPVHQNNATFELNTTNTSDQTPNLDQTQDKTFDFNSDPQQTTPGDIEFATDVLEDLENLNLNVTSEVRQELNLTQPRSPLAEIPIEEVVKADLSRTQEIEKVVVETVDTEVITENLEAEQDKNTIVVHRTEHNTVEVTGNTAVVAEFDPLEEIVNSNQVNTTFDQVEGEKDLEPENTPLPSDDFEDLPEENQENIPPIEIKTNCSVTETVAVVTSDSPIVRQDSVSGQDSTFEGDTAIFVGGNLTSTSTEKPSFDDIPVKGVKNSEFTVQEFDEIPVKGTKNENIEQSELKNEVPAETKVESTPTGQIVENSEESQDISMKDLSNTRFKSPVQTGRVYTYQESVEERPIKGVSHSESLAAFEKIEAEINKDTNKDFETPLSIEIEPISIQKADQVLSERAQEEPTFIVGTMPESKEIPMDVDEDTFDFPPPPSKEMLDEIRDNEKEPSPSQSSGSKSGSPLLGTKINGNNGCETISEVFVEDFSTVSLDATFKKPTAPLIGHKRRSVQFSASDFDYLEAFDNKNKHLNDDRSSLLLKFDPLLKQPVPDTQFNQLNKTGLIQEENEQELKESEQDLFKNFQVDLNKNPFETSIEETQPPLSLDQVNEAPCITVTSPGKQEKSNQEDKKQCNGAGDETMSSLTYVNNNNVSNNMKDVTNNYEDGLKSEKNIMSAQENTENMSELDKKVKNEVLKAEELEKKLEEEMKKRMEVEQREEQLLKRIVEKEKAYTKLQNIVAEYEKAISEMITEKEQLLQNEQRKFHDLHADSETNAHHLASLENTFSDLHAKYERTKQMAMDLKDRESRLIAEKRILEDSLATQEQRYEKMKNHAVLQLENANQKLSEQLKNHNMELTKLRAQLKKEEISRASIQEQLLQKTKENEELVKICDELINGSGGAGS